MSRPSSLSPSSHLLAMPRELLIEIASYLCEWFEGFPPTPISLGFPSVVPSSTHIIENPLTQQSFLNLLSLSLTCRGLFFAAWQFIRAYTEIYDARKLARLQYLADFCSSTTTTRAFAQITTESIRRVNLSITSDKPHTQSFVLIHQILSTLVSLRAVQIRHDNKSPFGLDRALEALESLNTTKLETLRLLRDIDDEMTVKPQVQNVIQRILISHATTLTSLDFGEVQLRFENLQLPTSLRKLTLQPIADIPNSLQPGIILPPIKSLTLTRPKSSLPKLRDFISLFSENLLELEVDIPPHTKSKPENEDGMDDDADDDDLEVEDVPWDMFSTLFNLTTLILDLQWVFLSPCLVQSIAPLTHLENLGLKIQCDDHEDFYENLVEGLKPVIQGLVQLRRSGWRFHSTITTDSIGDNNEDEHDGGHHNLRRLGGNPFLKRLTLDFNFNVQQAEARMPLELSNILPSGDSYLLTKFRPLGEPPQSLRLQRSQQQVARGGGESSQSLLEMLASLESDGVMVRVQTIRDSQTYDHEVDSEDDDYDDYDEDEEEDEDEVMDED